MPGTQSPSGVVGAFGLSGPYGRGAKTLPGATGELTGEAPARFRRSGAAHSQPARGDISGSHPGAESSQGAFHGRRRCRGAGESGARIEIRSSASSLSRDIALVPGGPGVGEASTTMAYLSEKGLDVLIRQLKQPVLGICLGMQLMCSWSQEGDTPCLGIFDLPVKRFDIGLKIPHMGWNSLQQVKEPLFAPHLEGQFVYFVHSYYVPVAKETAALAHYGIPFSAALQKDNFFATQFHPEKSGDAGEKILKGFLEIVQTSKPNP